MTAEVTLNLFRRPGEEGTRVAINGEDITDAVYTLHLEAGVDMVTALRLDLRPHRVEVEGHQIELEELPTMMAIREWLDTVDPSEVEKEVLDLTGPLGNMTTGEAFIQILKQRAEGKLE